jgi:hypothetical protein
MKAPAGERVCEIPSHKESSMAARASKERRAHCGDKKGEHPKRPDTHADRLALLVSYCPGEKRVNQEAEGNNAGDKS